jgi:hypothetical protein
LNQSTTSKGTLEVNGLNFSKEDLYIPYDDSNRIDVNSPSKIHIDGETFSSMEEFFKYIKDLKEENKRLRKRLGLKAKE